MKKAKTIRARLLDPQRGSKAILATAEEKVRQRLVLFMTQELGYPDSLLCVEKELSQLPHLRAAVHLPKRRIDILCFAPHKENPLYPLLLVECKAGRLDEKATEQALGYNHFVQAPFVAVANDSEILLIYPERLSFLPRYEQLLKEISL